MSSRLKYLLLNPLRIPVVLLIQLPYFRFIRETGYITFGRWYRHKFLNKGGNREAYWPVDFTSKVVNPENILIGIEVCPGIMQGCYIQGIGKVYIGDYTQIGPKVSIISGNHDLYDSRIHNEAEVHIGKYCWLGAESTILPGVELGNFTIVGAGAVVTKSFPEGYCVIGGNPARVIKQLEKDKCVAYRNDVEYVGYIPYKRFEEFRKKKLKV